MTARAQLRPVVAQAEDPQDAFAEQLRDRIASRDQRMDERFPKALDLEARVVAAMHEQLHGCASAVAGVEAPEQFREVLRGLRSMRVGRHLCRLALSARPEAGRAVDAALQVLAAARGYRLEPVGEATTLGLAAAGGDLAREAGDVSAALMDALEDGKLDPAEIERLKREVGEMERAAARLRAQIAALEGRTSRGEGSPKA